DANPEFANMFDPKKRKDKNNPLEKLDAPDAPSLDDKKKDEKDPQADEAVAIARDMITTWPLVDGQAVAEMKMEPDVLPVVKAPEAPDEPNDVPALKSLVEKLKAENAQL